MISQDNVGRYFISTVELPTNLPNFGDKISHHWDQPGLLLSVLPIMELEKYLQSLHLRQAISDLLFLYSLVNSLLYYPRLLSQPVPRVFNC
ncbi:hypothetical protein J6590_035811 [Homalodisca vitripennis]|nr:hypothetical protein J6590_035811 [Homalodisca vitripennis]